MLTFIGKVIADVHCSLDFNAALPEGLQLVLHLAKALVELSDDWVVLGVLEALKLQTGCEQGVLVFEQALLLRLHRSNALVILLDLGEEEKDALR